MYDKLLNGVRKVLYSFSVAGMIIMLVTIFAQVVSRYMFNYTPEWSEELSRFLFVWVVFLGSALIMGESGHLAVEFMPNLLKGKKSGKILTMIIILFSYLFIAILFTQGLKMTTTMTFQKSPGLDISMSYVYSIIPLSSVLMLLYLIKDTIELFKGEPVEHDEPLSD